MRYLKKYENETDDIEIGEYVICNDLYDDSLNDFLNSNIGQYISDKPESYDFDQKFKYIIKYEYIHDEFFFKKNNIRAMLREEIIYHSKNKNYLEDIIAMKNFNL